MREFAMILLLFCVLVLFPACMAFAFHESTKEPKWITDWREDQKRRGIR